MGGFAVQSAYATIMVEVALEDMIRDSIAIVHARVVRSDTQMVMGEESYDPHTVSTLEVRTAFKGEVGPTLQIREFGGTYGNNQGGRFIDGTPQYHVGEEVIVFLQRDPSDATYFRTYAMSQGKFVVMQGIGGVPTTVARDTRSLAFARWKHGRMTLSHGGSERMQFDAFVDLIRTIARLDPPNQTVGGGR